MISIKFTYEKLKRVRFVVNIEPCFIIKKKKLILQKILRKYDLEITTLLSCKYYVRLSERGRKELLRRHIREKTVIEAVQKLFKI